MKFYGMEKTHVKFYWQAHRSYKHTKQVGYLFNMMNEVALFQEEITTNMYIGKNTVHEYSTKYDFLILMKNKCQDLFHELQCEINEMQLDIIYKNN